MRSIEALGLMKLDLLGNRALAAIEEAEARLGRTVRAPSHDPATFAAIHEGRTIGCFQIETPVMRGVLRKVPIRGIDDLVAALAIVRPGPASGAAKAEYVARARGERPARAAASWLEPLLRASYGMVLYEEDLMNVIARTAESVLFPRTYGALCDPVTTPGPYLVEGRVEEDHEVPYLVVTAIQPFRERAAPYGRAP